MILRSAAKRADSVLSLPCPPPFGGAIMGDVEAARARRVCQPFHAASERSDRRSMHIWARDPGSLAGWRRTSDPPPCPGKKTISHRARKIKCSLTRAGERVAYPISRSSFQKAAQELQLEPIGFSIRVHVIGTGRVCEMSVSLKNAIPGRFGELHTHPPALSRVPQATWENPGA